MKIFLTGSSGCIASVLLPRLFEQDVVEQVVGIDIEPPKVHHPKFKHVTMDMCRPDVGSLMKGMDAVIHLGFAVRQGKYSPEEMRAINVGGGCNVVDAAKTNQISKLINMSSASIYGGGLDLTEVSPQNPSSYFLYAQHKADLERYISANAPHATQFRSHLVVGPNALQFLRDIFRLPVWLSFGSKPPKQQVVHEQDVADAILLALQQEAPGYFNLAAPEIIALGEDYIRKGKEEGRKIRKFPFSVVRFVARVVRSTTRNDTLTFVAMLDTSLTVNCEKAKNELGWIPKRSAWDARRDTINSYKTQ